MGVILNRIDRGSIRRDADGWVVEEHAYVDGVTGNASAKAYKAATAPGLPVYGAAHPSVPGVFLTSIEARPEPGSTDQWAVTLVYRKADDGLPPGALFGPTEWSIGSTSVTEETTRSVKGEPMVVSYQGAPRTICYGKNNSFAVSQCLQGSSTEYKTVNTYRSEPVSIQRPTIVITATRSERDPPTSRMRGLIGSVNSNPVTLAYATWPKRAVLCTGVQSSEAGDGLWRSSYEFQVNPSDEGWSARLLATLDGQIPEDVVEGNGIAVFDVYRFSNFTALRL